MMTDVQIVELIDSSLAEEFELDRSRMAPPARLREDLELDSLDAVDMVVVLERAFGLRIRQEEALGTLRTLEDLHRFVIGKVRAREGAGG